MSGPLGGAAGGDHSKASGCNTPRSGEKERGPILELSRVGTALHGGSPSSKIGKHCRTGTVGGGRAGAFVPVAACHGRCRWWTAAGMMIFDGRCPTGAWPQGTHQEEVT